MKLSTPLPHSQFAQCAAGLGRELANQRADALELATQPTKESLYLIGKRYDELCDEKNVSDSVRQCRSDWCAGIDAMLVGFYAGLIAIPSDEPTWTTEAAHHANDVVRPLMLEFFYRGFLFCIRDRRVQWRKAHKVKS